MTLNPTTFRFPFKHPDDVTDQGFRLMQQGILDLNQAIASLHSQVQTNAANVKNVTQQINASTTTITGTTLPVNVNQQTADYILQQTDFGGVVVFSGTGPYVLTPNQGITQPFFTSVLNLSSGNVVVTPVVPNLINNLTDITILPTQWAIIFFDSINWWALDLQAFPISKTATLHEFFVSYDETTGLFVAAQPAIADLSDAANVVQTSRTISTTAPLTGGGDLSANRTLAVSDATSSTKGVVQPDNSTITISGGVISAVGGSGTVTSVSLTAPTEFTVTGSPVTTSGTLAIAKANQSANQVYAGPSTGAAAAPTFRSVVTADLPYTYSGNTTKLGTVAAGALTSGHMATWDASGNLQDGGAPGGTGTVTSVDMSVPTGFTISGNPITTSGTLALGLSNESANKVWAGPASGAAAAPAFRSLVAADIPTGGPYSLLYNDITASPIALASWTWVNQGTATATQAKSKSILMHIPRNATLNWRLLVKSPVYSTPYKVRALFKTAMANANSSDSGIYFRESSSGKLLGFELLAQTSVNTIRAERITNPTTDNSTVASAALGFGYWGINPGFVTVWQLRNDGSTLYLDYSLDGENFTNLYSEAVGAFLTPDQIGFGGVCVTGAASDFTNISIIGWLEENNATL